MFNFSLAFRQRHYASGGCLLSDFKSYHAVKGQAVGHSPALSSLRSAPLTSHAFIFNQREADREATRHNYLFLCIEEANMTDHEATTFKYFSIVNAEALAEVCPDCEAYRDWFTYGRWKAQGEQVEKGQHGTRIAIIHEEPAKGDGEDGTPTKIPSTATVFCRHQIAK